MNSITNMSSLAALMVFAAMLCIAFAAKVKFTPDHFMNQLSTDDFPLQNLQDFQENFFDNYIDHFDPSNVQTYRQRYFVNDEWFNSANPLSPVMIYIGCEGELSQRWLSQGLAADWAKKLGGLIFALEHRYYGKSTPTSDWSIENLKYLTTPNALEDAAHFIKMVSKGLGRRPWITFGGSYGGTLSAMLRIKYPHLVAAAISASGPFEPQYDFQNYLVVAENALQYYGGSQCVDNMQRGNKYLSKLILDSSGTDYQKITEKLSLCTPMKPGLSRLDAWSFWQSITDSFAEVVQYNKEAGSSFNLKAVCDIMARGTSDEDKFENIITVHETLRKSHGDDCREWDFKWNVAQLTDITPNKDKNMRQWIYQSITNYGFFQSNSGKTRAFGDQYPADFFEAMNQAGFGQEWTMDRSMLLAERFNSSFGGQDHRTTGIIYTNGNIDPWHALSVTRQNPDEFVFSHFINGTSHCATLYPSSPYDLPQLTQARDLMFKQLNQILAHFPETLKRESYHSMPVRPSFLVRKN